MRFFVSASQKILERFAVSTREVALRALPASVFFGAFSALFLAVLSGLVSRRFSTPYTLASPTFYAIFISAILHRRTNILARKPYI